VCRFHEIHLCTSDACNAYIGTHDGVCPISGVYHGHTEGEKAFVMPEKRTAHIKRNGVKGLSALDARQREASVQEDESTKRRIRLQEHSKQNVFGALFKTTEASSIVLAAPPPPPPAQKTKREDVEEKIQKELSKGVDSIAPKRQRSQTNSSTAAIRRKRRLYEEAESIVSQLLYSDERRKINAEKRAKLDDQKKRAVKAYYADRAGVTFPILTEMLNKVTYARGSLFLNETKRWQRLTCVSLTCVSSNETTVALLTMPTLRFSRGRS
jgi:hypothetical protein